eukprot:PLAT2922.1.p1 GENE.PLAT2922.1~~PLAT2922.1.p1  ORF type:complete len:244 (+),score=79.80 PLAT2922.1:96-734(+)
MKSTAFLACLALALSAQAMSTLSSGAVGDLPVPQAASTAALLQTAASVDEGVEVPVVEDTAQPELLQMSAEPEAQAWWLPPAFGAPMAGGMNGAPVGAPMGYPGAAAAHHPLGAPLGGFPTHINAGAGAMPYGSAPYGAAPFGQSPYGAGPYPSSPYTSSYSVSPQAYSLLQMTAAALKPLPLEDMKPVTLEQAKANAQELVDHLLAQQAGL